MVSADTDNERTVLEFFRILSTGDLEAIRQTLHDEVTWTPQVKDIPGAGTYHGKKGVCDDFLGPVRGMFAPGDPKTTVKTIVSRGPLVMCESEGLGKLADGRTYHNRYAWAVEVRDGKIFAVREYMDSHYVAKLFGVA
jgi:ketosteroid isomerase-like protein